MVASKVIVFHSGKIASSHHILAVAVAIATAIGPHLLCCLRSDRRRQCIWKWSGTKRTFETKIKIVNVFGIGIWLKLSTYLHNGYIILQIARILTLRLCLCVCVCVSRSGQPHEPTIVVAKLVAACSGSTNTPSDDKNSEKTISNLISSGARCFALPANRSPQAHARGTSRCWCTVCTRQNDIPNTYCSFI